MSSSIFHGFYLPFFRFEGLWRKMMTSGRVQGRKLLICLPPLMKYWDHMIRNYALMLVVSQHYNSHPTCTDIYCMYSTVLTSSNALHPTALLFSPLQHMNIPYHTQLYCYLFYFNDIYCMCTTVLTSCNLMHPTALLLTPLQHLTIPCHTRLYCSLLYCSLSK